jgi:hypothetical protein
MPPTTLKDLIYPFGIFFGKELLDNTSGEPTNTPVSQDLPSPPLKPAPT